MQKGNGQKEGKFNPRTQFRETERANRGLEFLIVMTGHVAGSEQAPIESASYRIRNGEKLKGISRQAWEKSQNDRSGCCKTG